MRVLVIGVTGTLGSALCAAGIRDGHEVIGASRSRPNYFGEREWRRLDVRDRDAVDYLIGEIRPDLVLNSASVVGDWEATAIGAGNVASAAARRGVRQLLMSTDAVFASRDEEYREEEPPSPVTPYGAAKAAAETAVSAIDQRAAIVRTSLIVGSDGNTPRESAVHEAVADPASRVSTPTRSDHRSHATTLPRPSGRSLPPIGPGCITSPGPSRSASTS